VAYRRIENGWQGVFRHVILELMPANAPAGAFSPGMGTPTKELYSMAGLLLPREFQGWTKAEAVEAYMFHADVQYALNLEPANQSLCERTIERYERIFVENAFAARTMARVPATLVELLDLDVSRQRLDSTHVFSDMATFGRARLLGVTIQRFLVCGRYVVEHAPKERRRHRLRDHRLASDAPGSRKKVAFWTLVPERNVLTTLAR
jgi:hypothetical protein